MDSWEARRAHQLSKPSREGLALMARALDPGVRPTAVKRLGGGLGAATHAVDLVTRAGAVLRVVLKRYRNRDAKVRMEWEHLRFASRLEVPTPDPLALDLEGEWFGTAALVMRRLPGRADHSPSDPDAWLSQIASTIVAVSEGPRTDVPSTMRRSFRPLPQEAKGSPLAQRAVRVLGRELPRVVRERGVVAQGDFHPGNLLWRRGRLTGVVDWSEARLAPRAYDVAYCRADLCVLGGLALCDGMLSHYKRISGRSLDDLPVWDLYTGLGALRWSHWWALTYAEQGRTDLTNARVKARASAFVRRALAEFGA